MDHSASAQFMKRPRMNSVIVFPVHDSCLSPNKDETAVFGCHFSGTSVIAVRMPAVLATLQEHHGVGVDVCPPYSLLFFFRALLDSPAFAALANRWCRYCLIDCYRDGACFHFRFSCQRAMMFIFSYIAIQLY